MNHIAFATTALLFTGLAESTTPADPAPFAGTYIGSLWSSGQQSPSTTRLDIGADRARPANTASKKRMAG
jgi:hypothetical protein